MPIDRGEIDRQLQALRESSEWWDVRELRDLPSVLNADEQILALSRGKIGRPRFARRTWLIVVTDRRLFCIRSAGGNEWRQLEIAAGDIARVAMRIGLLRGRVIVAAGGQTYRLLVPRNDAYKLLTAIASLGAQSNEAILGFAPTRLVRRVMDHVLALPVVALNPEPQRVLPARVIAAAPDPRVETLEDQVQELRQQVEFLEQLLRHRHDERRMEESFRGG
jgi:hypothetical protein